MSIIPLSRRLIQVFCSITWCLLAAGPVFGFAALKPILIDQKIYHDKCTIHSNSKNEVCAEQDLALNFMFTLAAVVTNVTALPVGSILDVYGPRVTGIIGSIIIFLSSLLLSYGSGIRVFDAYLIGYSGLALGGPFVFISSFQLANSFPRNSGLILALLTGSFDTSSALFLIYRLVYFSISKISFRSFFSWYLLVPAFILLCQLLIMPKESYKSIGTIKKIDIEAIDENGRPMNPDLLLPEHRFLDSDIATERTSLLYSSIRRESTISRISTKSIYEQNAEDKILKNSGVFGILHGIPAVRQIETPWFILMTFFTTIQMLRINYFVATIKSQEEYLFNDEIATDINHFFDIALPLGGLVSIPIIGLLLDNLKSLTVLAILTVISLIIGALGLISNQVAAYSGIMLLVVYRPFYYTTVSDFCAKVFGFDTFGTIYGLIICISGLCNFFQKSLDEITHQKFNMNPIPVNFILLTLTGICGSMLLIFVRSQELNIKRKQLEVEAELADEVRVPS